MRMILAAAVVVIMSLVNATAFAQKVPQYGETDKDKSPSEIAADKEAERAYKRSLGNIPDQGATDPWGAVRSTDAPKTPVTKAKSKPSTAHN
jgi:hypothetical protein